MNEQKKMQKVDELLLCLADIYKSPYYEEVARVALDLAYTNGYLDGMFDKTKSLYGDTNGK